MTDFVETSVGGPILFIENQDHPFRFSATVTNGAVPGPFNHILAVTAPSINLVLYTLWTNADLSAGGTNKIAFSEVQIPVVITSQMRSNMSIGRFVHFILFLGHLLLATNAAFN